MHRTTILLPRDLHRDAEKKAASLGISLSELIRRQLTAGVGGGPKAKTPRFFLREPWRDAGASDVAANHDRYLYGE